MPATYTDPVTGMSAHVLRRLRRLHRVRRASATSPLTNPNYQIYKGVDLTATKRFSNRGRCRSPLTIQDNPNFFPAGSPAFINPTGH